jgi:hypothetical protein
MKNQQMMMLYMTKEEDITEPKPKPKRPLTDKQKANLEKGTTNGLKN